jgi:hypothetical protein
MIEIIERSVIFHNPRPEDWPVVARLPAVEELSNDEIFCVYRRGTALRSPDGAIAKARSSDGGKSWVQEGLLWDPGRDSIQFDYSGPFTTKLKDGALICAASRWDRSDRERFFYNPKTDGYNRCEILLFRSIDLGKTWSPPQVVELPEPLDGISNHTSPIIELEDGELLLTFDTWKTYDDPNPVQQRTFMVRSTDGGRSWSQLTKVADGAAEQRYYWDGRVVNVGGDRLLVLFWTRDARESRYLPIHSGSSLDGGRSWTKPTSTGIPGQTSWIVGLGCDRVMAVYSLREPERPGIRAVISENLGKTWDLTHEVVVYDALGKDVIGGRRGTASAADTGNQAFGRPCARPSTSGDILVSYWCTQCCVVGAHFCRLRVD